MIWLMILLVPLLDALELTHRAYDRLRDEPRDERRPRPRPKPKPTYTEKAIQGISRGMSFGPSSFNLPLVSGAVGGFGSTYRLNNPQQGILSPSQQQWAQQRGLLGQGMSQAQAQLAAPSFQPRDDLARG